ncbi:hypothetical protein ACHAW5_003705 [Stephanodiscus triporus]|uniref:Subtilisin n=1 Tax=Stephanodiscus triporus TaxID=2934178 RepID=A0ABD3QIW1_9STRA
MMPTAYSFDVMANYGYNLEPDAVVKTATAYTRGGRSCGGIGNVAHRGPPARYTPGDGEEDGGEEAARFIGAVTDGKANPLLMVFTLAPYFDFCISWEDDASGRTEFFKELGNIDGNARPAVDIPRRLDKYREITETKRDENEPGGCGGRTDVGGVERNDDA